MGVIDIEIRVSVHSGEVELVGDNVRGIAVHTAARLLALAGPGEVLVSSTTNGLPEGSGMALEDAGVHELKGLAGSATSSLRTGPTVAVDQDPARPQETPLLAVDLAADAFGGAPVRRTELR